MKPYLISLLLLAFCYSAFTQQAEYPYAEDIRKFKEADRLNPPPSDAILFVGSSSFTMWTDVQEYFPGYTIINRGFGGSTLLDEIHYINDVVFPYSPKQIVIYCGENDVASSDTVTGEVVFDRFRMYFDMIRKRLPDVPIAYISMKPSPSRWNMADRLASGNHFIREFLMTQPNTAFIGVWEDMLGADHMPNKAIFIEDMLHMNADGYKIWQRLIEPVLVK